MVEIASVFTGATAMDDKFLGSHGVAYNYNLQWQWQFGAAWKTTLGY